MTSPGLSGASFRPEDSENGSFEHRLRVSKKGRSVFRSFGSTACPHSAKKAAGARQWLPGGVHGGI